MKKKLKKHPTFLPLHLKIDTRMGRLGVRPQESLALAQQITHFPHLKLEGLCTHYANTDNVNLSETVLEQWDTFQTVRSSLAQAGIKLDIIHTANTGATFLYPKTHADMVRVGLCVYGYFGAIKTSLIPILSLKSKIMLVKKIKKGDKVSYGYTWTAKKDTQISIIPAGYADGYTLLLSNKGKVLIENKLYPIIGEVCMDQLIVDISRLSNALEKDVLLYGNYAGLNAFDIAEVFTTLSERVSRIYI